jgi:hypothetical protein
VEWRRPSDFGVSVRLFLTTGFSDQITNAVDRDRTRASSRDTTWQRAVPLVNGGPSCSGTIRPPAAKFVDGLMAILGFLSLSPPAGFYYDQNCTTIYQRLVQSDHRNKLFCILASLRFFFAQLCPL